jgi:hypothetical protein
MLYHKNQSHNLTKLKDYVVLTHQYYVFKVNQSWVNFHSIYLSGLILEDKKNEFVNFNTIKLTHMDRILNPYI